MRLIVWLIGLAAVLGAVALFTKPSEKDAERALKDQLLLALAKEDLKGKSAAEQLALTICRTSPNECYELVRSQIDTSFTDQTLYVQYDMEGFDHTATCYGAFKQFICPGGLIKD